MKLNLLILITVAALLSSCTGNRFTARKYTTGHYLTHKYKASKPEARRSQEPVTASIDKKVMLPEKEKKVLDVELKKEESKEIKSAQKKVTKGKELLREMKNTFAGPFLKKDKTVSKDAKLETPKNNSSLLGFVFGIAAIAVDIIVFLAAIAAAEYIILLGFLFGIILGILGIVFGAKGLSNYNKHRGETKDLVFSIVGLATGAISIFLAVYLAIYAAFIIAAFSEAI
jgi:hypothetical protein